MCAYRHIESGTEMLLQEPLEMILPPVVEFPAKNFSPVWREPTQKTIPALARSMAKETAPVPVQILRKPELGAIPEEGAACHVFRRMAGNSC